MALQSNCFLPSYMQYLFASGHADVCWRAARRLKLPRKKRNKLL
jgi:hypothetical protein